MCVRTCVFVFIWRGSEDNLRCHPSSAAHIFSLLRKGPSLAWASPNRLRLLGIQVCTAISYFPYL